MKELSIRNRLSEKEVMISEKDRGVWDVVGYGPECEVGWFS